jgi:hypothetical protein
MTGLDFWFWNIVIIVYFSVKDFLLSKLFKEKQPKSHPGVILVMTVAALVINNLLLADYNRYLDMGYIKGAIQLPPFPLLFILADFISSAGLLLMISVKLGFSAFRKPGMRLLTDVLRLVFIYVVFLDVTLHFYIKETSKQMETFWTYPCFKDQVAIDLAVYYYKNGAIPSKLDDFTNFKENPVNKSPLIYTPGSQLTTTIIDGKDNKILVGYKDLMGLEMYKSDPPSFFTTLRISNKTMCSGSLNIPPEYNKDR